MLKASIAGKHVATNSNNVIGDAFMQMPKHCCKSFSLHSPLHSTLHHNNKVQYDDNVVNETLCMAIVAVWMGACVLEIARAHDVASTN